MAARHACAVASKEHEGARSRRGRRARSGRLGRWNRSLLGRHTCARAFGLVGPGLPVGPNSASTCNFQSKFEQLLCTEAREFCFFRGKQNLLRSAKHSRTMIDTWTPARLPHYRPWFLKKSCLVFASGLDGQAHGPDASGINQEDKMRQNMDGSQLKTGRLGTPHKWNRRLC